MMVRWQVVVVVVVGVTIKGRDKIIFSLGVSI